MTGSQKNINLITKKYRTENNLDKIIEEDRYIRGSVLDIHDRKYK